ncbi:MAG: molybdate ABC transporter substrate-binding protein [Gammaproteobacteria bacterium]|nr:MAG: molybdate ABC transporter substrate-binding protein [Gammaproteobacteria bacterium]
MRPIGFLTVLCCVLGCTPPVAAETVRVAVAANFAATFAALAAAFEQDTGIRVEYSAAASGRLYAQIVNGAPYALFLAADETLPQRLAAAGRTVPGTLRVYAIGVLALWSPGQVEPLARLRAATPSDRLVLANPRLAPYGAAAREALAALGLDGGGPQRLYAENAQQAVQWLVAGGAELGFVPWPAVQTLGVPAAELWRVPDALHRPLRQAAVLLEDTPPARALFEHLCSPQARARIAADGYRPGPPC